MNANLKAASDCFIDKSLLKCLVVNDNVNIVCLMTSLIYVTLLVVVIFIMSVFLSHWRNRDYRTSSPMGIDRSPESQHNVGDTIIYDAQRQTVFNLGIFNGTIFIQFQMKIKHCPIFPHSHNG